MLHWAITRDRGLARLREDVKETLGRRRNEDVNCKVHGLLSCTSIRSCREVRRQLSRSGLEMPLELAGVMNRTGRLRAA